jgi:hypothetical protein
MAGYLESKSAWDGAWTLPVAVITPPTVALPL